MTSHQPGRPAVRAAAFLDALATLLSAAPAAAGGLLGEERRWSDAAAWEGGKTPPAGAKVLIRTGHAVTYDVHSDRLVRSPHVSGTLSFARDRNTRLDAGLNKVQAGESTAEERFDCEAHVAAPEPRRPWRSAPRTTRSRTRTPP